MSAENPQESVQAEAVEHVSVTDTATVLQFKWSSIANARTAVLMARRCEEQERNHPALVLGSSEAEDAANEHWASASSSVVASAMFLEANINELFLSARISLERERTPGFMGRGFPFVGGLLSQSEREKLDGTWGFVDGASVLDKYQFVLVLLGKEAMDKGSAPFQPTAALIDARNKLIHYKQGLHEAGVEQKGFGGLQAHLGGRSFQPHPFTSSANAFYPDQFFSYAGCRWAWATADAFAQRFHERLGIEAAYQPFRAALTLS